ncbi:MAG: EcoRII N-terminal effector-binding domain-containing protein [Hyphomicrobiales bacterium]
MAQIDLTDWLSEFSGPQYAWLVKRLSGNDTLADESHQAGPYLPRDFAFEIFPSINTITEKNPGRNPDLYRLASDAPMIKAIYYNSKPREGKKNGRNESG